MQENIKDIAAIIDNIPDGFVVLDRDWNFTYINKTFAQTMSVSPENYLGRNFWEVFPKAKELSLWEELHFSVKEQIPLQFETYIPVLRQTVSVSAYPAEGRLAIFFQNISKRNVLNEKIMNDEENLKLLVNNTEDPIWAIDTDYHIILCNVAFKKWIAMFIGKELVKGDKVIEDGMNRLYVEKFEMCYKLALMGRAFRSVEDMNVNGQVKYTTVSFNPVFDNDNKIIGVSCFARDITEQREHLYKIEKQNTILMEIASIQSHKVRGPIATIMGLAQLFNMNDPSDPVNADVIKGVNTVTQELDKIVNEVVKMSNSIGI